MAEIILASSSPRRQELLKQLGIPFLLNPVPVDEQIEDHLPPGLQVEKLAANKAKAAAKDFDTGLVIGSDTIVVLNNQVLGKPQDYQEALQMLTALQGTTHKVYTGLAIVDARTSKTVVGHECTSVCFRSAAEAELKNYIDTGEPFDKAGAYGIQGLGSIFVSKITGCYYNVVGLPVAKLAELLKEFGVDVTKYWGKFHE